MQPRGCGRSSSSSWHSMGMHRGLPTAMLAVGKPKGKEVKEMPSLRHLLDELGKLNVEPDDVRLSGQLYDELLAQTAQADGEKGQRSSEGLKSEEEE